MRILNNTLKAWYIFFPTLLFFIICLYYPLIIKLIPGYNLYDAKRILELLLLTITGLIIIFNPHQELDAFNQIPVYGKIGVIIFFGLGIISSIFAPVTRMALLEVSLYILLFCYALFIAAQRYKFQESIDTLLLSIITLSVISYIVIFLKVYLISKIYPSQALHFMNSTFPGFMNLRFFSQYLIWTLPLIPAPYLLVKKFLYKAFFFCIASLWWTIALYTTTKSIWVALAISILFYIVIFRGKVLSLILLYLKIFICAEILNFLLSYHTSLLSNQYSPLQGSVLARTDLIIQAKNLILAHPLLGAGPMHFAYYINNIAAHPHNSFLQIASEWGLPACVIILGLFALSGISWLKLLMTLQKKNQLSSSLIMLSIAFLAGVIDSLMDGVIVTPLSQVMLFFYIGWILGIYQCHASSFPVSEKTQQASWLLRLIILCSLAAIITGIFPEILYLSKLEMHWYMQQFQHHLSATFSPRFWVQGWIN